MSVADGAFTTTAFGNGLEIMRQNAHRNPRCIVGVHRKKDEEAQKDRSVKLQTQSDMNTLADRFPNRSPRPSPWTPAIAFPVGYAISEYETFGKSISTSVATLK